MTATKSNKSKRRYEDGAFFKLDKTVYYIESHVDVFFCEGDYYSCIEVADGSHHQIPYTAKGLNKHNPSSEDLRAIEFYVNRRNGFKPDRVGEIPETVCKGTRVELVSQTNLEKLKVTAEFGLDIETFGLEHISGGLDPYAGEIRTIQVFIPSENLVILWDLGGYKTHIGYDFLGKDILVDKCEDINTKAYIHNAAFEQKWFLIKLGCYINNVWDSMLMSQIRWAGLSNGFALAGYSANSQKGSPHTLKNLVARLWKGAELSKENQLYDYGLPLGYEQYEYAAVDAIACYHAAKTLATRERGVRLYTDEGIPYFLNDLINVYRAENGATTAFSEMCHRGIPINLDKLEDLIDTYSQQAQIIHDKWLPIYRESDGIEDLASFWRARSIKEYFEKKFLLTLPSLERKDLKPLAEGNEELLDFMLWKSLDKNVTDFKAYKKLTRVVNGFTVLLPNYTQLGKEGTGRTTSSNPNCQNFTKLSEEKKLLGLLPFKTCLEAPPSYKWIVIDLEGSHAQIARQASGDRKLVEARQKGIKIHFYTVQGMYFLETGLTLDPQELKKAKTDETEQHPLFPIISQLYDPSKTVFYGFLNLQGRRTLQGTLNQSGIYKTLEECQNYIDATQETYKDLYQYQLEVIRRANSYNLRPRFTDSEGKPYFLRSNTKKGKGTGEFGVTLSLCGGHQYLEKEHSYRGFGVSGTKAVANAWQRVEGTIIKQALAEIHKLIHTQDYDAWLAELTHDEVGIITKEEQAKELATKVRQLISDNFRVYVPDYDAGDVPFHKIIGDSWGDLK